MFYAIPENADNVYENEVIIDVGLSKCMSVPIELIVSATTLYNCVKSGKLLLDIESIFSKSKLEIKEISSKPITLEDQILTKRFSEQLKQTEIYSNKCATLLESIDKNLYYEKLYTLLYLEGDYRRRLLQRYVHTTYGMYHSNVMLHMLNIFPFNTSWHWTQLNLSVQACN